MCFGRRPPTRACRPVDRWRFVSVRFIELVISWILGLHVLGVILGGLRIFGRLRFGGRVSIASSMWSQAGNLAQDARIVVAHYQRFRKNAGQVLDRKAPGSRDSKTGLMRRGLRPITSVRGVLSAKGHNLTLRAFAAFFAARRAYLSAPESLSPEARKALRNNPDPILRQHLRVA